MQANGKTPPERTETKASQDLRPPGGKIFVTRLLLTAVVMLIGMSVYHFLEFFLFPNLTVWQSGIITILFSMIVATVAAYVVLRKIYVLLERLSEENRMRKKSEEKLSKLFLANPNWVIISRLSDGCYIDVNEAFLRMTGYAREEVIGHSSLELHIWVNPEERHEMVRILLRDGRVADHEVTFGMKSGKICYMLWSAERIDLDGEACMIAVCKDITERKLAAEERERLINMLENALRKVMHLSGFLPICTSCKKVRDNHGHWNQIESYIHSHSEAKFRHSICPDCAKKVYAKVYGDKESAENPASK